MKTPTKTLLASLAVTGLLLSSAKAQITVDSSFIDTTGTITSATGGFIATGTISSGSFSTTAQDNLIVVELSYRTLTGPNPGVPTTLSFTGGGGVTLNLGVNQNSVNGSYHNVGIYYAFVTAGTALTGTVTGTLPGINSSGYSLSIFGAANVNSSVSPLSANADAQNTAVNTLTLNGVGNLDTAFAVGLNGIGSGSTVAASYSTITASSGTVVQNSLPNESLYAGNQNAYTNPSNASSNFDNGYITGLTAGTDTFTSNVTASNGTGNKNVFAVLDFQAAAVPEPSQWALLVAGLAMLLGIKTARRQQA